MSDLTGGEARAAYAASPVILIPMGSQEDQGPHAPMGDFLCADKTAELIALRASAAGTPTFVAPVIPYGGADYFGSMPGGIALSQATLRAVIGDMLGCLLRHGLRRIIFINGHGGNVQAIHDACHEVYLRDRVLIPSLYLWKVGYALLPKILGPELAKRAAGHGADPLTSVAMHLFPELIRADMTPDPAPLQLVMGLQAASFGNAIFEGVEISLPVEYHEVAANGVRTGDPRVCSAETGAAVVERLVEIGAKLATHVAAHQT
jgi:creatinine amidohydrolase